jgi:hypothetical protein
MRDYNLKDVVILPSRNGFSMQALAKTNTNGQVAE